MLQMTNDQLIDHLKTLLRRESALDLEMVEGLREVHERKLYLAYGSKNFHVFCTEVLGMSADSAWRRIHAASLVQRFPEVVKPLIAEGRVHLTGLALLDRVITPDNGERLIQEAVGKSTVEIKAIIAREAPETCKPSVRKVPTKQMSESTWRFQAVMDAQTKALLDEVEELAGGRDPTAILRQALKALRAELKVKKQKALKRPAEAVAAAVVVAGAGAVVGAGAGAVEPVSDASMRRPHDPHSRYIPRWMEREIRERDGHQCTFVGVGGRCTARSDLQVHHIEAFALGGLTVHANLTVHCGEHNRFQAVVDLGKEVANAWRMAA